MTSHSILAASSLVEKGLVIAVSFTMLILLSLSILRRGSREADCETLLSQRLELVLLAVILGAALFVRTVGYGSALTAPSSFSALTALDVDRMLTDGTLWHRWMSSFTQFDSGAMQNSGIWLPVAVVFQVLLGPSLHLPLLIGASHSIVAVLLAWALGRAAVSRAFGLTFGALLAASPLQIVWSRLGGIHITAVTYVLLTLWCSYVAGKRRSLVLSVVTGLIMWMSVYQYYAARLAMPLGIAMLLAGLSRSRGPLWRTFTVLLVAAMTLVAIYSALGPDLRALWPSYGAGYVGNKGEKGLDELLTKNVLPVSQEVVTALRRYFLVDRVTGEPPPAGYRWGMQFGGLCLVPVAVLGLVGLAHALRRPGQGWPWLLLAAAGLSVPVLSVTTARRLLIFDLAWCALASAGLLLVARSRLVRGVSARVRFALVALTLILIAGWSSASVLALNGALSPQHFTPIPFGESGFGDGLTCLRCLQAAYQWQDEIGRDGFVVLFDTDLERENSTCPGGISLYGRVAALSVHRPENFLDFYPIMRNLDFSAPAWGRPFFSEHGDFASYIVERIEAARPKTVLWHFERPTQWEHWLANRLADAGGVLVEFQTPLSRTPGLQVRTHWSRRKAAFGVLEQLVQRDRPLESRCPSVTVAGSREYPFGLLHLGVFLEGSIDAPAEWIAGSYAKAAYGTLTVDAPFPVGSGVDAPTDALPQRVHMLTRYGDDIVLRDGMGPMTLGRVLSLPEPLGLDCAVRVGSHWWAVDPTTGEVMTSDPVGAGWVPKGRWIGIAAEGPDRIVLGAADQWISVVDVGKHVEIRRFPASVPPSRRVAVNECSPILSGAGWYATFNHMTSMLSLYDEEGRAIGTRELAEIASLGRGNSWITAVAATGPYLAIGHGTTLVTAEVRVGVDCADRTRDAAGS